MSVGKRWMTVMAFAQAAVVAQAGVTVAAIRALKLRTDMAFCLIGYPAFVWNRQIAHARFDR